MKRRFSTCLLGAALLFCGACANVRQAPVVERQDTDAAEEIAARPDTGPAAGVRVRDEEHESWTRLPQPEPAPPRDAEAAAPPLEAGRHSDNPAVIALLDDTDSRTARGDTEGAAGSLERALGLEPKNPWLWHRLAVLRLRQGQWRQAIALAGKSNSLAARRPELLKANAGLIERALAWGRKSAGTAENR